MYLSRPPDALKSLIRLYVGLRTGYDLGYIAWLSLVHRKMTFEPKTSFESVRRCTYAASRSFKNSKSKATFKNSQFPLKNGLLCNFSGGVVGVLQVVLMSVIPEQARQNDPFLSCYVCYAVFYQFVVFRFMTVLWNNKKQQEKPIILVKKLRFSTFLSKKSLGK